MVIDSVTSMSSLIKLTENAKNFPEIIDSLLSFIKNFGLDGYAYVEISNGEGAPCRVIASNWPVEWGTRYLENEYWLIDPLLPAAVLANNALDWSFFRDQSQPVREFFDDAAAYSLKDGLTIPLHDADRSCFLFSFSSSNGKFDRSALPLLRLAAIQAHGTAGPFRPPAEPKLKIKLTNRENQVLTWCAVGKSTRDIAEILGIAESSVDWYFRCVFTKLGVSTRAAAVARAMILRLITVEGPTFPESAYPLNSEG